MLLLAVFDGKRYGYATPDKRVAISPRFTKLPVWGHERFVDGRAVGWEKAWGYVTADGRWAIQPKLELAWSFRGGRARVAWKHKTGRKSVLREGYLDTAGDVIGPESGFFKCTDFSEGRAFVEFEVGQGAFLVDELAQRINETVFGGSNNASDVTSLAGPFAEGKAAARDPHTRLWGYVNRAGSWVIEPRFAGASPFSEGLACVSTMANEVLYIDEHGTEKLRYPVPYLAMTSFSEGLVAMPDPEDTLAKYYVDREGRVQIASRRGQGMPFVNGRSVVQNESGRYGFMDATGKMVIEPRFAYAEGFRDRYARVVPDPKRPGRYTYIDPSGRETFACDWNVS